jgi:CheY-specific phosphatase CheX
MPDHELHHLLAIAVEDVLETMFFSETFGPCEPEAMVAQLEARVAFSGASSGSVAVRISESSARSLAASFLGEAEDSQVVCEVANILCGSIVTKMESQGCFDLGAPELYPDSNQQVVTSAAVQQSFAIERGTLTVSLMSGESA